MTTETLKDKEIDYFVKKFQKSLWIRRNPKRDIMVPLMSLEKTVVRKTNRMFRKKF